jgi:hypothetical protein
MCCEQLVCAACTGRVSEARCPVCRAYRDARHAGSTAWSSYVVPLLAALAALLVAFAWYARMG